MQSTYLKYLCNLNLDPKAHPKALESYQVGLTEPEYN